MKEDTFEIKTPGVEVDAVMAGIRERIVERKRSGELGRYDLSSIRALELANPQSTETYLDYYLKNIWSSADVDLGDFPIERKKSLTGRPEVWLKKIIWKLLKFYTFRLFSQQKNFNARMAGIAVALNRKYQQRLDRLEAEVEELRRDRDQPAGV